MRSMIAALTVALTLALTLSGLAVPLRAAQGVPASRPGRGWTVPWACSRGS